MSNKEGNTGTKEPTDSKYEVIVKLGGKEERIKDRKNVKKEKLTTYMLSVYRDLLKEMSDETGISMTKLINQAVDEFLQDIDRIDGSLTPPISRDYLRPDENGKEPQKEEE